MAKKMTKKTLKRPTVSISEAGAALEQLLKRITDQRDLSMKKLPDGIRFKRDAWISLQEKGMLTASSLMKEQERIHYKESTLSSNERKLVTSPRSSIGKNMRGGWRKPTRIYEKLLRGKPRRLGQNAPLSRMLIYHGD